MDSLFLEKSYLIVTIFMCQLLLSGAVTHAATIQIDINAAQTSIDSSPDTNYQSESDDEEEEEEDC